MKYKVGDKVRIRKDLISGRRYHDFLITRDMCEMGGEEAVVKKANNRSYILSTEGAEYNWTDEMLEPVETHQEPYGFRIEGGGINKEDIRKVLKDHATRNFHDPETDVIEMLIPVPLATDIICQYIGIGAKGAVSEPKDSKVTRHKKITEELTAIYEAKNHDYGDSFQETYRKLGLISAVTRITDKVNRLQSLSTKEQRVAEESIKDTLMDCANYCIMTIIALEGEEE